MVAHFTAKTANSEKAIYLFLLIPCSINKLKSHMLFTGNVFRFYLEKKFLLQEMVRGGGWRPPCPPPSYLYGPVHRWIIPGQLSTDIQYVLIEILISLQNTAKFYVISPRNMCPHAAVTRSFQFMIFITLESRDKTSKNRKKLVSISWPGGKKQ